MIPLQTSNTAHTPARDDENKGATVVNSVDSSNNNSSGSIYASSASSRPALSITATTLHCLCGESLCGYDCHFLQQQFKDFEAVARRQRQRPRRGFPNSKGEPSNQDNSTSDSDDDDKAIADLERRFCRHFGSAAASTAFDDTCLDDIIATPSDADVSPPARMSMRRTKSCGVHSSESDQEQLQTRHNAYRLRIGYRDEALRERCEQNTQALLQRAVSDSSDAMSTATILARKALRYRKILERMEGVDVNDPELDVSKCLGVRWQRVISPE